MSGNNVFPIRVTLKCELDCGFCVSHDPEGRHMPLEQTLQQDQYTSHDADNIFLIHGGNPVLHPDIVRIAAFYHRRGRVVLRLPGPGLTGEMVRNLRPHVDMFRVVVPALNPALYRRLTRTGDISFMFKGLKLLLDNDAPVEIEVPVLPGNLGHLGDMVATMGERLHDIKGVLLVFQDVRGLFEQRKALWSALSGLAHMDLPWVVHMDPQSFPPPCTAPSESDFLDAEVLFDPGMRRPQDAEERMECLQCAIRKFCPSNNTSSPWAEIAPTPIPWDGYRSVPCIIPWTHLDISEGDGQATPCCRDWVSIQGESVFDAGLEGAWNSGAIQRLRSAVSRNQRDETCKPICPFMHSRSASIEQMDQFDEYPGLRRLRAIAQGRGYMDEPPMSISVGVTTFCNLRCVMCRVKDRDQHNDLPAHVYEELYKMAPRIKKIAFTGGEPLLSKRFIGFLKSLERQEFPGLTAHIITNGTVLNRALMHELASSVLGGITISLNAATKNTYESINRGAKWERTIRNIHDVLDFIKQSGMPVEVVLSFVILRSNMHEMRLFVHLARSLGAQVRFMVNTNDPGAAWRRGFHLAAAGLPGVGRMELVAQAVQNAREWFIGEHDLCREAVMELQAAVKDMQGMSPGRIKDARSVLKSLKSLC